MEKIRIIVITIIVAFQSIFSIGHARENIKWLNPTGYSLEVAYDDAPFFVYNGTWYALPKGLKVQILADKPSSLFCQLPDGSRGYISDYFFGGYTMELSDDMHNYGKPVKAPAGVYDVLSWGTWTFNKDTQEYDFFYDNCRLRNQENGDVVSIPYSTTGKTILRPYFLHYNQVPEQNTKADVYLLIKNADQVDNLVGQSLQEIEGLIGRPRTFAGDALTDAGYAFSFYDNVAYADGKARVYGLAVYFDKNSECVAAVWEKCATSKKNKDTETSITIPLNPSKKTPVEIVRTNGKLPRYNLSIMPVVYDHNPGKSTGKLTFDRFMRIFIAGENVPSTLISIIGLYGLFLLFYIFFLKHVAVGSNNLHITIAVLVGLLFFGLGIYALLKYRVIEMVWSMPLLMISLIFIGYKFQIKIIEQRCPYCYYFYGKVVSSTREGGYDRQSRNAKTIRNKYSEIGELKELSDEQVRRWETVYKYELKTIQYGEYTDQIICPHCIAQWIFKYDLCENEITDVEGYSTHVREEIWRLRK